MRKGKRSEDIWLRNAKQSKPGHTHASGRGAAAHYGTSESEEVVTKGGERGEGRCQIEAATLTSQ